MAMTARAHGSRGPFTGSRASNAHRLGGLLDCQWSEEFHVYRGQRTADARIPDRLPQLVQKNATHVPRSAGFLIVRRMVRPVRVLTERLRHAQIGELEPIYTALLRQRRANMAG